MFIYIEKIPLLKGYGLCSLVLTLFTSSLVKEIIDYAYSVLMSSFIKY